MVTHSFSPPKSQALTPSPLARVTIFWLLPVLVSCGLTSSPYFQAKSLVVRVLGYILGFLTSVWVSAYFAASWQMKRLPSSEELEEIGGKQFVRPSDGKILEYWLSGELGSKTVVVFCHRMDGKIGVDYGKEKVQEVLTSKSACLLSVSTPSISASPAYDSDSPVQWLRQWNQDMLALLQELGARNVYVLGLSWSGQPCVNLAMALQEQGMLRGVGCIGAAMWETKSRVWNIPSQNSAAAAIFSKYFLIKPLAYLMIRPFVPMMGDVKAMGETEATYITKFFGGDVKLFGEGTIRSLSYFLHQNWQLTRTCLLKEADEYVDWAKFDPSIPFHLNIGIEDDTTRAAQPQYNELVKHAKLQEYEGSHGGFPLDRIIEQLF